MNDLDPDLDKIIHDVLQKAIRAQLDNEIRILVSEAKKKLDERIPEIISAVSIDMMSYLKMESYGRELHIRFKLPEKKDSL